MKNPQSDIDPNEIFVFGSNLAGSHGAGSARHAHEHYGAILGCWVGRHGQSYAIPTKDHHITTMPLEKIKPYIKDFLKYAINIAEYDPNLYFTVVEIGCGLAGYKPVDIAPMFRNAPKNVRLPEEFVRILGVD